MTLPLFKTYEDTTPDIDGLCYRPDFISAADEAALLGYIDQMLWRNDLKRRVQHYGYRYDYKAKSVSKTDHLGPLPDWLQTIAGKLKWQHVPDQAIVNEYQPGQGISPHIDCVPCFGQTIASLSLGSLAIMQFGKDDRREELYLEPRSLLSLSGPARYEWTHAIPARKSDTINGVKTLRQRRVSVTFRCVNLS